MDTLPPASSYLGCDKRLGHAEIGGAWPESPHPHTPLIGALLPQKTATPSAIGCQTAPVSG
jgi:hypothetical protein